MEQIFKKEATRLQDLSLLQGVGNSVKEQLNELEY